VKFLQRGDERRPRSDEVDKAILRATSELLSERGLDAMTIEDVAARAASASRRSTGAGPPRNLALDAFLNDFLAQQPPVDDGTLKGDFKKP